jgi:hypothetical protein
LEKALGRFYEGPEPPPRLTEELKLFRVMHPLATPAEWEAVAARLIVNAYRDGYVRGFEAMERDPSQRGEVEGALLLAQREDWSLAAADPRIARILATGRDDADPLAGVPPDEQHAFLEALARRYGVVPEPVRILDDAGQPWIVPPEREGEEPEE